MKLRRMMMRQRFEVYQMGWLGFLQPAWARWSDIGVGWLTEYLPLPIELTPRILEPAKDNTENQKRTQQVL